MDYSDLQQRLNAAVERYDSQTFLGSFRETIRSSLLKEGLSTRANSLWKMAEFVVAKRDAESPDGASSGYLIGWKTLASNYNNQTLLLEVGPGEWEAYDAQGVKLGNEDYIKDVLTMRSINKSTKSNSACRILTSSEIVGVMAPYLAAIRTKPFVLLAGISGTGKSRMVRELARGCCPRFVTGTQNDHPLYDEQKPGNFETIAVRPNWHDSTELLGYVSRISGHDEYQVTDFVKFLCKAWRYEQEGIPFFLCLDEMNLAPVEQYFAEYLSVIESRQHAGGKIVTDPLIRFKNDNMLKQVARASFQCDSWLIRDSA